MQALAIVTGVSEIDGIELSVTYPKSISASQFVAFLESLAEKNQGNRVVIFLDNMRAHHSRVVKEAFERLGMAAIFNLPYSPQFNGIESVFSMMKTCYKRILLRSIMRGERLEPRRFIQEAVDTMQKEKIAACLRHSMSEIDDLSVKLSQTS